MKRNIRTKIKTVTLYKEEYTLDDLEKKLAEAKTLIPENEKGLIRVMAIDNDEDENLTTYLDIFSVRLETDEEEQARLERDRRFREAEKLRAEEKERRWYEKLKAKYEPVKD